MEQMSSTRLASGHEVVHMSEEWLARMGQDQTLYNNGMVRLLPDGWLYPTLFTEYAERIYNFKFRSSDVVVMTMPKSGTTWMQEVVWTMLHNPDLNHPLAGEPIYHRSPEIDLDMILDGKGLEGVSIDHFIKAFHEVCPGRKIEDGMAFQMCELMPDPRVMKSHLPFALLTPHILEQTKVIYVARSPKDVVVSYYYFFRVMKLFTYTGTFESFVKHFMNNDLIYTPYWPHVKQAWQRRDHPNMYFVFYEEMKSDIMTQLRRLNDFLGLNLTQKQLDNVAHQSSFNSMKERGEPIKDMEAFIPDKHKKFGGYFRKGIVGDWKNHFTPELEQEMNQWIEKHASEIGITFK
ncbi:sulfotransferase 1A1 [Cherax quadricarinatus]|uniref:sulfotransferase 1A1 n=1 Tax=Cherax quadricarinatus TaxID=27406 RepID=UPI002377F443|nr:sulfotransferase 1A1-like [Cherax quadricarinatus]XP_053635672.1 sulfotransferase 1A1-like [Cherax quadricarinatus]